LKNVDGINLVSIRLCDGKTDFGAAGNGREKRLALDFAELLGIVQPDKARGNTYGAPGAGKDDCRGEDRPGQRPTSRFVHAGDQFEARIPKRAFVGEPV